MRCYLLYPTGDSGRQVFQGGWILDGNVMASIIDGKAVEISLSDAQAWYKSQYNGRDMPVPQSAA